MPAPKGMRWPRNKRRQCAPPAGSTANPSDEIWTKDSWKNSVQVYFAELNRISANRIIQRELAKMRPKADGNYDDGPAPQSAGGVWVNNACAYCLYRPLGPPGERDRQHPLNWMHGTGDGAHSPFYCGPFMRAIAEPDESMDSTMRHLIMGCLKKHQSQ